MNSHSQNLFCITKAHDWCRATYKDIDTNRFRRVTLLVEEKQVGVAAKEGIEGSKHL